MKSFKANTLLIACTVGAFVIVVLWLNSHRRVAGLKHNLRDLRREYQESSSNQVAARDILAANDAEITRLRGDAADVLRLRNEATRRSTPSPSQNADRGQKAVGAPGDDAAREMEFSGYNTPQNAFRSAQWAMQHGDYDTWLASLSPEGRSEQQGDPNSTNQFLRTSSAAQQQRVRIEGEKFLDDRHAELKVRFESESSSLLLIVPVDRTDDDWKLGEDFRSFTSTDWDRTPSSPIAPPFN